MRRGPLTLLRTAEPRTPSSSLLAAFLSIPFHHLTHVFYSVCLLIIVPFPFELNATRTGFLYLLTAAFPARTAVVDTLRAQMFVERMNVCFQLMQLMAHGTHPLSISSHSAGPGRSPVEGLLSCLQPTTKNSTFYS